MGVLRKVVQAPDGRLLVSGVYVTDEVQGNESLCNKPWKVHFDPTGDSSNTYTTRFRGESGGFGKHPVASHAEFRVAYSPTDMTLTFEPYPSDPVAERATDTEKRNVYAQRNVWRQISVATLQSGVTGMYLDYHHGYNLGSVAAAAASSTFVDWAVC
jgi:hypothetical protein